MKGVKATTQKSRPLQLHEALEWIIQQIASVKSSLTRIEDDLDQLGRFTAREAWADRRRDLHIMATLDDVIAKATEAKTVSESTNIAVREVIRLLKEGQTNPAKVDQAIQLLEAMRADDASMLTDNTPAEPPVEEPPFEPSRN